MCASTVFFVRSRYGRRVLPASSAAAADYYYYLPGSVSACVAMESAVVLRSPFRAMDGGTLSLICVFLIRAPSTVSQHYTVAYYIRAGFSLFGSALGSACTFFPVRQISLLDVPAGGKNGVRRMCRVADLCAPNTTRPYTRKMQRPTFLLENKNLSNPLIIAWVDWSRKATGKGFDKLRNIRTLRMMNILAGTREIGVGTVDILPILANRKAHTHTM